MSLCGILQSDFEYGHGRFDGDQVGYTERDLAFASQYALNLLEDGETKEPLRGYDLIEFYCWCQDQLAATVA